MLLIYISKTKSFENCDYFIFDHKNEKMIEVLTGKIVLSANVLSDLFDAELKKISLYEHFACENKKEYPELKLLSIVLKKIIDTQSPYAMFVNI